MIGYVTLGTNDMARAGKFYDALLAEVGGKRQMETERFISWSSGATSPGIGVIKPFDGKTATVGNGMMVALMCESPAKVKAIYDKALKLGGKDEGAAPFQLLLSALAACTVITLRMYAQRKGWGLKGVDADLRFVKNGEQSRIDRTLVLQGDLTPEQRARLGEVAENPRSKSAHLRAARKLEEG